MPYLGKRCFVLDLDGTVYLGDIPIKGAVAFIRDLWRDLDFYFLSNNTSKGLDTYVQKLNNLGIAAGREHMLSPTAPMVDHLRKTGVRRAFLVGNRDYRATLLEAMPELVLAPDNAQAVLLAYDTELTYAKLAAAAHLLQKPGVAYLATHPDLVCPDPAGPLPDVGSFIALFEKATGRLPQKIFGKPDPAVLAPLIDRYAREEMVMVGDRLSTDKKLAENAGIDFVLVLSGEATAKDVAGEIPQPWRIVEHLGKL
ncbi:MAG: HAD-IIA family hydrolase [Desulfovibrio sp.]|jgi:HAD superfamily hydrolase (TIGR01450 family)|nr:HAD-IIA family hydrolase [Desulfovibrio sp.]